MFNRSGSPKQSKYFCNICNKPGHTDDRCFRNPNNTNKPDWNAGRSQDMNGGFQMPPKYFCDVCKKPGHTADRCFQNNQGMGMSPSGMGGPTAKYFCDICKKPGHTADRCFKNPNNPNAMPMDSKPPSKYHCDICDKDGHTADRCFKNPNNPRNQESGMMPSGPGKMGPSKFFCDICQKPGHSSDRCFKNPNNQGMGPSGGMFGGPFGSEGGFQGKMGGGPSKYFCQICNKPGHTSDRCFKNPNNAGMNAGPQRSNLARCTACNGLGHTADKCLNAIPGNMQGGYGEGFLGQQDMQIESD